MSKIATYFKDLTHGNYKISMGVLADVNALAQLAYDILPTDCNDSWYFEKCAKNKNSQSVIVVKEKKEIIGFLCYRVKNGVVEILDIGIKLVKQRQGIGTALVNVLFLEESFKEIWAIVGEYNLAAQKFLKKCGIKYWKTDKEYYGKFIDGYLFRWTRN